jgi:hypothetical protein
MAGEDLAGAGPGGAAMSVLTERVRAVEERVAYLDGEVAALRRELETARGAAPQPAPAAPAPRSPRPLPKAEPRPEPPNPLLVPRGGGRSEPARPLMDLVGPRALAWLGGVAMLFGIAFLFVLAVRNGWVDEELRVVLGAAFSCGLVGAGILLHRRHGRLPAALVAVGTGLAGLYVTIVAATALYELVPERLGMALADLVGAAAVLIAIRWRSQTIAALGLVGAILAVPVVALQIDAVSVAFAAGALAAAAAVAERQRWTATLVVGLMAAVPQVAALGFADGPRWPAVLVAAGFGLACLRSAVTWQSRHGGEPIAAAAAALLSASAIAGVTLAVGRFAVGGVGLDPQALALAAAALAYLAAAFVLRRRGHRDAMSIVGGLGLALAAASIAELTGGVGRVAALGGAALLAAWLAGPARERRLLVAGAAGAALSFGFALVGALSLLVDTGGGSAVDALALLIGAGAAGGIAWLARREPWAGQAALAALAAALVAAWGGILAVALALAGPDGAALAFQRGQAAATLTWALCGLALMWLGVRPPRPVLRRAGTGLLILALGKLALFDLAALEAMPRALAFLAVGAAVLTAGALVSRLAPASD